jgi:hypothetical protein
MYTKDVYDPPPPVISEEAQKKGVNENADGEVDEEQGEDDEFSDFDTDDDEDDDGSKVRSLLRGRESHAVLRVAYVQDSCGLGQGFFSDNVVFSIVHKCE